MRQPGRRHAGHVMATAMTERPRNWLSERGAEFVEMALAFPLLLLVVLGIVDFGLMFQQYEVLTNAAREGARVGVLPAYGVNGNLTANVTTRVTQYLNASFLSEGGTVTVETPTISATTPGLFPDPGWSSTTCITTVTVTLTYPHQFLFVSGIANYFGQSFGTKTLKASASMRSETPTTGCVGL